MYECYENYSKYLTEAYNFFFPPSISVLVIKQGHHEGIMGFKGKIRI